jgi:DNA-directed RNA polymerase specialized sigma24 family protein
MEDAYIVNLYWARNEDAIPKTAEKYGLFCYTIAKNILTFHEEAEECVNDTYLQAWNAMPPHSPGCLRTFLGKLTRNISFNRYKRNTAANQKQSQRAKHAAYDCFPFLSYHVFLLLTAKYCPANPIPARRCRSDRQNRT